MTDQLIPSFMISKRNVTLIAFSQPLIIVTFLYRTISSAIFENDDLLILLQGPFNFFNQCMAVWRTFSRFIFPFIDDGYIRHLDPEITFTKKGFSIFAC